MSTKLKYCFILFTIISISACNVTRVVPENNKLLVKNKIHRGDSKGVDLSDEGDNLKQKPNRELLGFIKFHLWAYQYGNKGLGIRKKQPWLRRLAEKIGEAPVLVDSNKMELSALRLSDYYFSKGFLDNKVSYDVKTKRFLKKRAIVSYNVNLNNYHVINTVEYNATSQTIELIIQKHLAQQKIKVGQRLDLENVESERNRLTDLLRNNGFYYFNSSYIDFQVDTNQNKLKADIVVNVRNKKNYEPHFQQKIDSVIVQIGDGLLLDTMYKGIRYLESDYHIRRSVLEKNIAVHPGDLYDASKVQRTYSNLLNLGLFNFVTIRFRPSSNDSSNLVVAEISLQTAPKHDFIWEPQAITTAQGDGIEAGSERNFGIANTISLNNRNVFGGAESFNLRSYTAIETQLKSDNQGTFTNFRQSVTAEFVLPSLLFFNKKIWSEGLTRKSTKFNTSYLHDRNINYTRNVIPFNFIYSFTKDRFSFGITPFRVSINQSAVEEDFLLSLDASTRFYTTQLLTNNLIAGPTTTVFWSNKDKDKFKYFSIRSNALELSGNLLNAYYTIFTEKTGINKEFLGVKYSQYARSDIDVAFNYVIDENNAVASRFYSGFGLPYGNTRFLPFERRFFVGGGNSLRAWRPRTIGPGSFSDSTSSVSIEKTGEIVLQANAEYRFDIIDKYVDGAIFLDAGNVWNFEDDINFENAEFKFNRFYKEFAVNSGIGLRFDLTYVIFRVDWGIALHDPSYLEGQRWVIKDFFANRWINDNSAVNFAVGYPF
ncbi:MAG: BamA/TamA family outer membrane protein [Bacteroidia bacterium]|nr:BamA/TamA family outer membrane protein [Bacteroidia bacterium]